MKKVVIICMLLGTASVAGAQAMSNAHWDENTGRNVSTEANNGNKFSDIEMSVDGKVVSFSHIPVMPQAIEVVVTSAQGDEVARKGITPLNSVLELKNVHKGKMYFVAITYGNKTQKAFTLHI